MVEAYTLFCPYKGLFPEVNFANILFARDNHVVTRGKLVTSVSHIIMVLLCFIPVTFSCSSDCAVIPRRVYERHEASD